MKMVLSVIKETMLQFFLEIRNLKGTQITLLVQKLWQFCWIGGLCLLVELHKEASGSAACAACLFSIKYNFFIIYFQKNKFLSYIKKVVCWCELWLKFLRKVWSKWIDVSKIASQGFKIVLCHYSVKKCGHLASTVWGSLVTWPVQCDHVS